MAVRVVDSSGRRAGLPGRNASIYTMQKYGGMLFDEHPVGLVVYRSTAQTIAASTWAPVSFDTLFQADGASRSMWSSGSTVTIVESDWYFLSATVQFAALGGGGGNQYIRSRFSLSTGVTLPGSSTYYPNQYSFPMNSGLPWYITAGTTLTLDVSHTSVGSMTLNGGFDQAVLKIGRLSG